MKKNETNVKAPENLTEEDLVKNGWSQEDLSVAYKEALEKLNRPIVPIEVKVEMD